MLNAAFNSIAGFDDGSDTASTYKDVLKHKNQNGWWDSMKKELVQWRRKTYGKLCLCHA
jgi:hypothetical protein